jgi:guanylate kinase
MARARSAHKSSAKDKAVARRGMMLVLSSPSGAGKTTLSRRLLEERGIELSISVTTRPKRRGEVDGRHYHFIDINRFEAMARKGDLLEHAEVFDNRYGTPRKPVEQALAEARPALLEIDLQGARQVRDTMPEALFVFLMPPSWDELVRRLVGRGTETEEERERRLATARGELAAEAEFDVTIVNHEVHAAAEELVALVCSEVADR